MIPFRRILFPVDLSEESTATAPFVKAFADGFHSDVILLHVFEVRFPLAGVLDSPAWPLMINFEEARSVRQSQFDAFLPGGFEGLKICRQMADGDPALQIVSYAEEKAVDLIMMPTHGYGPFRRLLLGSVTAKVLHDAQCPVWTSVHTTGRVMHSPDSRRPILCAVDTNETDVEVVRWAVKFGAAQGVEFQLVHAMHGAAPDEFDSATFDHFLARSAQVQIAKMQAEAGTALKVHFPIGNPAKAIHKVAVEQNADLLIIGRGVLQSALGRLRSHEYSIIRESPCPVISI